MDMDMLVVTTQELAAPQSRPVKPCLRGHTSARNSWGQCLECRRIYRNLRSRPGSMRNLPPNPRRALVRSGPAKPPAFQLTDEGHDLDPPRWDDDGGKLRVCIWDHNFYPKRLARKIGWVNCLGYGARHRFLSPNVAKCRICTKCKTAQRYQDSTTIV